MSLAGALTLLGVLLVLQQQVPGAAADHLGSPVGRSVYARNGSELVAGIEDPSVSVVELLGHIA